VFEKELESAILDRQLKTNKDIYCFALHSGMLARHARDAVSSMIKEKKLPNQNLSISYSAWKKGKLEDILHFKGNQ